MRSTPRASHFHRLNTSSIRDLRFICTLTLPVCTTHPWVHDERERKMWNRKARKENRSGAMLGRGRIKVKTCKRVSKQWQKWRDTTNMLSIDSKSVTLIGKSSETLAFQIDNESFNNNNRTWCVTYSLNLDFSGHGRQASKKKISLKRTSLEGLCPPRDAPQCLPATKRYRTHDGTCNNNRRPRWGSAHLPFHRFLAPDYADGLESVR